MTISPRALHRPAKSRTARNRYLTLPIMREGFPCVIRQKWTTGQ